MKCTVCKTKPIELPKAQMCLTCYKRIESRNQFRTDGKWSKYSDRCKECKSNQYPHHSWGFCDTCYMRIKRRLLRQGLTIAEVRIRFKKKVDTQRRYRMCQICGTDKLYSYGGSTEIPVCFEHYYEWRKTVPCDGCGQPCTENAVDTEDNGIVYWWHFTCWERACSTEQKEQLLALTTAL